MSIDTGQSELKDNDYDNPATTVNAGVQQRDVSQHQVPNRSCRNAKKTASKAANQLNDAS